MKTRLFSIIIILLCSQLGIAQVLKTKELSKTYAVNPGDELYVKNSFGMIRIDTWEENKLEVNVQIKAEKRNERDAQELLDRISIEVTESGNRKAFVTDINGSIKNKNGETFRIEYQIKMPRTHNLEAEQSFGELYVDDVEGDSRLTVKYGSMVAGKLDGNVDLEVSFSNAEIESMKQGNAEIKYGSLDIEFSENMELEQQFSDVSLGKIGSLRLESKYGNVEIEEASIIDGETNFSNFNLERLNKRIDLRGTYGDGIEIESLSRDFEEVRLKGKYGGFEIGFEEGLRASIEVEVEFADLKHSGLPINFSKMQKSMHSASYTGTLNGGGNRINIESEYGDVRLGEN